jgi:hypothetical protein
LVSSTITWTNIYLKNTKGVKMLPLILKKVAVRPP